MQRKSSVILNDARKGTFSYGFTHLLSAGVSLSVSECIAEWKPWYTSRIRYTGTGCLNIVWFTRDPKVLTPQASNQKETAKWATTVKESLKGNTLTSCICAALLLAVF